MDIFKKKAKLKYLCAFLSIFTLIAYHIPFFSIAVSKLEGTWKTIFVVFSLMILILAITYFFYYLVLWLGRIVGKIIIAASFICNAAAMYFINTYEVVINDAMMGNVFNTRFSEASGFFSSGAVIYLLFLGILPSVYLFARKTDYGSFKRFSLNVGGSLGVILAVALINFSNWSWMHVNLGPLGSYMMPWSYVFNSVRYYNSVKKRNRVEIKLPDAVFTDSTKSVCLLVIGESARRDHFSLYGYERETNPLLKNDTVVALPAIAAATYTTEGVKAILNYTPGEQLYEPLPSYLSRAGAYVLWRSNNWGEQPLHIDSYQTVDDLKKIYPDSDPRYDAILLEGLAEQLLSSGKNKVLAVLHSCTSHGPDYSSHYPAEFEVFTPINKTAEMSKVAPEQLVNSYDNSILYTDYLLHKAIEELESLPEEWRRCMIYVSDHGESLGENGLFMHGVTRSLAPREQLEIPFIVWHPGGGDDCLKKEINFVEQYNVFHSIMHFLGAVSEVYDENMNIFK